MYMTEKIFAIVVINIFRAERERERANYDRAGFFPENGLGTIPVT